MSPPESTSYLFYAGSATGVAGAIFLAMALLFDRASGYVSLQNAGATMAALSGVNADADLTSARDNIDTRIGIALFLTGVVGTVLSTAGVKCEPVVAFEPMLLLFFTALAIRETCIHVRERTIFRAQMLSRDDPAFRYRVFSAYEMSLSRRGRSAEEFRPEVDRLEETLGRHPWDELRP
jgi:uncharacterized membrane protein YfcA